jgi:hypothetical protein
MTSNMAEKAFSYEEEEEDILSTSTQTSISRAQRNLNDLEEKQKDQADAIFEKDEKAQIGTTQACLIPPLIDPSSALTHSSAPIAATTNLTEVYSGTSQSDRNSSSSSSSFNHASSSSTESTAKRNFEEAFSFNATSIETGESSANCEASQTAQQTVLEELAVHHPTRQKVSEQEKAAEWREVPLLESKEIRLTKFFDNELEEKQKDQADAIFEKDEKAQIGTTQAYLIPPLIDPSSALTHFSAPIAATTNLTEVYSGTFQSDRNFSSTSSSFNHASSSSNHASSSSTEGTAKRNSEEAFSINVTSIETGESSANYMGTEDELNRPGKMKKTEKEEVVAFRNSEEQENVELASLITSTKAYGASSRSSQTSSSTSSSFNRAAEKLAEELNKSVNMNSSSDSSSTKATSKPFMPRRSTSFSDDGMEEEGDIGTEDEMTSSYFSQVVSQIGEVSIKDLKADNRAGCLIKILGDKATKDMKVMKYVFEELSETKDIEGGSDFRRKIINGDKGEESQEAIAAKPFGWIFFTTLAYMSAFQALQNRIDDFVVAVASAILIREVDKKLSEVGDFEQEKMTADIDYYHQHYSKVVEMFIMYQEYYRRQCEWPSWKFVLE